MQLFGSTLAGKVMEALRIRDSLESRKRRLIVPALNQSFTVPFITIAREPGSGGKIIAEMLAKKLGYAFYDHQLIEQISQSTKLKTDILEDVDEKGRTDFQDFIQGLLNPEYISDITYFTQLCKVILSLAYKGKVVILGRGANLVTPLGAGLHVRITAPFDVRVARAVEHEHLSLAKARRRVRDIEADRAEFIQQYFSKDVRDADAYDLTINTVFFEPEESVDIVLKAFEKKFRK